MPSKRRNKAIATKFFSRSLDMNGLPRKFVVDKSSTNTAGTNSTNKMLRGLGYPIQIEMVDMIRNLSFQTVRGVGRLTRRY
nr:hypothetical protein [Ruegeria atlantica]